MEIFQSKFMWQEKNIKESLSIIGRIQVYIDSKKVADVVDDNPLQSGNGLSFRTGETLTQIDDGIYLYPMHPGNTYVFICIYTLDV